jgi:5-formyltetrahydrofolate cyclo-ligase
MQLRRASLSARRAMGDDERDIASASIAQTLIHMHEFTAAKSIACYLPMDDEVDPSQVIARAWCAKKRVFVPVTARRGRMTFRLLEPNSLLQRNNYGIWEPVSGPEIRAVDLDLVITPLAAFDEKNNRIGMGGGFYDRSFAFLKHRRRWLRPKLIGVAFDCQKVDEILPNPWDIRLYAIVSETTHRHHRPFR